MNQNFLEALLNWPKPYIQGTDLHHLLDKSVHSRYSIVKRALKEGYLTSIRRDLFLITHHSKQPSLDKFELAPIIYGPSYISFESSLSYHEWIPETVQSVTSATVKKAKEFETELGTFTYEHIPIKAFPLGVNLHEQQKSSQLIADPWKALADMAYTRKRPWETTKDLFEDLRIEPENLLSSNKKLLSELIEQYPSSRVRKTLHCLGKELLL